MLKVAYNPSYVLPVREGHRFPMLKYELIYTQLLHEGLVELENFFNPGLISREILELAHNQSYIDSVLTHQLDGKMVRRIGFPFSKELVDRELTLVKGTIDSCLFARTHGLSFNIAGGTHHAGKDFGEGFCLFNDQAVAAAFLIKNGFARRVLIIDLDVHQGNGTANIFHGNSNVFTFSMHAKHNFPFEKENSTLDIELENGVEDDEYLKILKSHIENIFLNFCPEFVFFQAGVDVLATDKLGKLCLSIEGCRRRDEIVFRKCHDKKIPVQVSMGGGYSEHIKDIVNAHVSTFRVAIDVFGF